MIAEPLSTEDYIEQLELDKMMLTRSLEHALLSLEKLWGSGCIPTGLRASTAMSLETGYTALAWAQEAAA